MQGPSHAQAVETIVKTEQDAEALRAATSAMLCVLQELARRASELGSSLPTKQPSCSPMLHVIHCNRVPSSTLPAKCNTSSLVHSAWSREAVSLARQLHIWPASGKTLVCDEDRWMRRTIRDRVEILGGSRQLMHT